MVWVATFLPAADPKYKFCVKYTEYDDDNDNDNEVDGGGVSETKLISEGLISYAD